MAKEKDMKIYLASYQPGNGDSKNPETRFVGGTDQWKCFGKLDEREKVMKIYGAASSGSNPGAAMSVHSLGDVLGDNMKIHLAERDLQHHSWPNCGVQIQNLRLRILLSYWYYKDQDLDKLFAKYFTKSYPDVFADSGAYSAKSFGSTINPNEYAEWVLKWQHLFTAYANLDVIGDAKGTLKNQRILERQYGLKPLPVFHCNEDWKYLEAYISEYNYVALGGFARGASPKAAMPWMVKAFRLANKKNTVYHGFGVTSWLLLKALPWYSVDSSSWGSGFRYGRMQVFDSKKGKFVAALLGDRKSCYAVRKVIADLGFEWKDFADRSKYDRAKVCGISALSYMLAEQWLRKRHGEIHLYLADTSSGINYGDADKGISVYLSEHSLDKGGVGDTSRAKEALNEHGCNC